MICKRCKKVFAVFFCPECTEVSVEILVQMMEKELEKKKQNLTSRQSRAVEACAECDWRPTKPGWKCLTTTCEHYPPPA